MKLWDAATGKELATLTGHSNAVSSVAFSADGRRIASGSGDHTVKLWDAATGREIATLTGHSNAVSSVAFSADGRRIASGSWDDTVKLWDAATGKELAILTGHSDHVSSVAFSPDGSRIASGSRDKTVKLWDAATGKEIATFTGHSGLVESVAFSPDGSRIASGSWDNTVKLWDAATGKEIATFDGHSYYVSSVAFSADGRRIASGSEDKTVKLWDAATGKQLTTFEGHSGDVNSVAFSPDGRRIASGSEDKTVKLWDAATGKELATLTGHLLSVRSVAFSPDGRRIASGSYDKTVKLWDAAKTTALLARDPQSDLPDLMACERSHFFTLRDREVVWRANDSLLASRSYPMRHLHNDLLAQLADPQLSPAAHLTLRVQLCLQTGVWQMLPGLWQEARSAGLEADAALRRAFACAALIAVRSLAAQETPEFPPDLWNLLNALTDKDAFADPVFSLALARASPRLLRAPGGAAVDERSSLRDELARGIVAAAPRSWLEAVASGLEKKQKGEDAATTARRGRFLRAAVEHHPQSASLLRSAIAASEGSDPERIRMEDRLLTLPEAKSEDFANAAYKAAIQKDAERARSLLRQAAARFPQDANVHYLAGWCHLNLADPAAALRSFQTVRAALGQVTQPDTDLLAGLAISHWLTKDESAAVATYKQLIETGRAQKKPIDWADPKTIAGKGWPEAEAAPLEALRQATLAKYPDLARTPAPAQPDR